MATADINSFAEKICNVLNIENKRILKIGISIEPRDIVRIEIQKVLSEEEAKGIAEVLKDSKNYLIQTDVYELKPK